MVVRPKVPFRVPASLEWVEDEDVAHLVGLLAEPERLRVVAAVVLGHSRVEDIAAISGVPRRDVEHALGRLIAGGLIEHADGNYRVVVEALKGAARRLASDRSADEIDAPPEAARVLRSFFKGGQLSSIPASRSKRLIVLDYIAQVFEPGRRYPEAAVNKMLLQFNDDVAALRRYLVDEGLMDRAEGLYWRTGGSFDV
jgi:hypothetical protein